MQDMKEYTSFLCKFKITPNQLYFLKLTETEDWENMYKYTETNARFTIHEIKDLIKKKYLINNNITEKFEADNFIVTDKYNKLLKTSPNSILGEEFWELYPSFFWINEKKIPTKSTDKEVFILNYVKKIKNKTIHKRIINALVYAISRNQISMGILKWFNSEQWIEIEKERKLEINSHCYGSREL